MDIYVQSFLNSATKLTISANTTTSITQLKGLVNAEENVSTATMQFYIVNTLTTAITTLSDPNTLGFYGITTGTYINSSNTISSNTNTKEQRQILKLDLAKLRRQADGVTTATYYRIYNNYDRDLLAAKYVGNTATNISNTLVSHRPWTT